MLSKTTKAIRGATSLRFLFPLVALTLYLVVFSRFLIWLLPDENAYVTSAFIDRSWKLVAALTLILHLVFLVLDRVGRGPKWGGRNPGELPRTWDGLLILLPLTPVMQYILNNQNILSPAASIILLAIFAAFSFLFIIAIPAALHRLGPVRPMVFLGLAFTFTVTNMASLSATHHWFETGHFGLQVAVFVGVFFVGLMLYERVGRRFTTFVVVLYFVTNSTTCHDRSGPSRPHQD